MIAANTSLLPGQALEVAFDRLLLPLSVVRQTFLLSDLRGQALTPSLAYDPVARIVTIVPEVATAAGDILRLTLVVPQSADDANGLRALDGATLDVTGTRSLLFFVGVGEAGGPNVSAEAGSGDADTGGASTEDASAGDASTGDASAGDAGVTFCQNILPLFQSACSGTPCHGGELGRSSPADGLLLTSAAAVSATALGRGSVEANTGPLAGPGASPQVPAVFFRDMPVVDNAALTSGNPANSWLMYKVLMAGPAAPPTVVTHLLPWQPLDDDERMRLNALLLGAPMPSALPSAALLGAVSTTPLSADALEALSRWIAEGAPVPDACDDGS